MPVLAQEVSRRSWHQYLFVGMVKTPKRPPLAGGIRLGLPVGAANTDPA